MAHAPRESPMRIRLAPERRDRLVSKVQALFAREFEHELSEFQARQLVDFFVRHLGAPVYNQAVQDARAAMQTKLDDIEGEFHEPVPD
jgi:uncharacterized protein (DUF2164 family)